MLERRATLLLDVALALWQCNRIEQSYRTICAASTLAPEEIVARPAVRQLVADLLMRAPAHLFSDLKQLAIRVGVPGVIE